MSMTPSARNVKNGAALLGSALEMACAPSRQSQAYCAATVMPTVVTASSNASAQCSAISHTCLSMKPNGSWREEGVSGTLLILAMMVFTLSKEYLLCVCSQVAWKALPICSQMGSSFDWNGATQVGAMKRWSTFTLYSESSRPRTCVAAFSSSTASLPSLSRSKCLNAAPTTTHSCEADRFWVLTCASTMPRSRKPLTKALRLMYGSVLELGVTDSLYSSRNAMRRSMSPSSRPSWYFSDSSRAASVTACRPTRPMP
mmetsp:Transcript_9007/g.26697  ORF Transcript_9007/g.26697 Transcript_9007/m.26697 type:complete len:257 (-) Transcript_9007:608-1378(-)